MISKYTYNKLTWIDLESPSPDEVESVASEYGLSALAASELLTPTFRPKVDQHDNFIYMVLHFPFVERGSKKKYEQEVDFIVGKHFVITAHYESIDALNEFSKLFEINSVLDRSKIGSHGGHLFFYIIREMYHHAHVELDTINDSLHDIERKIFEGMENKMVSVISNLNRTLVDFKQSIRFHGETLASFERASTDFFGADFSYFSNAILGEHQKVRKTLEDHKEILSDLRETNDSLLTAKTNDIMTKLTIMNFIIMPLGLISWIFAMDSEIPYIKSMTDFFLIILAMALIAIVMFLYFRSKKWL
jgi:magnesium transporter